MTSLTKLSDRKLLSQMEALVGREQRTTLEVVLHLGEVERRRLYLRLAYSSMFEYCVTHLGYSRSAAGRRLQTARCARRHPELLRLLQCGKISLMTAGILAPVLTDENKKTLLAQASNKTQRELERLAQDYRPATDVPDRVRPIRVKVPMTVTRTTPTSSTSPASTVPERADMRESQSGTLRTPSLSLTEACDAAIAQNNTLPASEQATIRKLLVTFSASEAFMSKYAKAKALLSNKQGAGAGFEEVFEALLDDFIDRHSPEKRRERRDKRKKASKRAATPVSRVNGASSSHAERTGTSAAASERSRHIPAAARDEVFARDGGRCTFVGANGKRCLSRTALHVDHIKPFALGGSNDASNLRLLCANHNRLEAERAYGDEFMQQYHRRE